MSNEGFKVQASVKDNDGDMVNFRADTVEELTAYFLTFPYADYAAAKAALRGAGAASAIVQPVQQAPAPVAAPVQQQWAPAPQQQAAPPQWAGAPSGPANGSPHPENRPCPMCNTVLQYKAFNSKAGKALKMWACPNQRNKDDGHATVWVD